MFSTCNRLQAPLASKTIVTGVKPRCWRARRCLAQCSLARPLTTETRTRSFGQLRPRSVQDVVRSPRASSLLILLGSFGWAPQPTCKLLVVGPRHLLVVEEAASKRPLSIECVHREVPRLLWPLRGSSSLWTLQRPAVEALAISTPLCVR